MGLAKKFENAAKYTVAAGGFSSIVFLLGAAWNSFYWQSYNYRLTDKIQETMVSCAISMPEMQIKPYTYRGSVGLSYTRKLTDQEDITLSTCARNEAIREVHAVEQTDIADRNRWLKVAAVSATGTISLLTLFGLAYGPAKGWEKYSAWKQQRKEAKAAAPPPPPPDDDTHMIDKEKEPPHGSWKDEKDNKDLKALNSAPANQHWQNKNISNLKNKGIEELHINS